MITELGSPSNFQKCYKEIEEESQEFEEKRNELIKEFTNYVHEKELLKEKVEKIESELQKKIALKNEISNKLYDTYMTSIEKTATTIQEMEESLNDSKILVQSTQNELIRLINYLEKIRDEFLKIADSYEKVMGR